jgi:predicted nucleic acid-binding protein
MTLFIDTSALVKRYVEEPGRDVVVAAMEADDVWVASELARTEASLTLARVAATPRQLDRLHRLLADDWDAFHVVPVDDRCLAAAAELGANHGLSVSTAIHLAAASRLPKPVGFLTLDPRQVSAAVALDLDLLGSRE